jgi:hypothetical protein
VAGCPRTPARPGLAIAQAISDVIDNTVAHGIDGGHVAVLLEVTGTNAPAFELTIVDDGPSVPLGELPRLGERAFRSDAARHRDDRGRGLASRSRRSLPPARLAARVRQRVTTRPARHHPRCGQGKGDGSKLNTSTDPEPTMTMNVSK